MPDSSQAPRQQLSAAPRPAATAPRRPAAEAQDPVSEYAKRPAGPRPAPQGLDPHGRHAPLHKEFDEDHLEIPAFLRRQAN